MNSAFNAQNPDHITFAYPPIAIAVLGGIRLDGLDRMRVTLKIEHGHKAVRHNLDLYNDNQTEKLIRRAAEKLEIGTSFIGKGLADLTSNLEKYRLDEIARQKTKQEIKKHITEEERKAAVDFLKSKNLLLKTNDLIGQSGVIGEETNRLLMYLIFTSRKREHPLHIVSMGSSGAGKSYLQEKVAELIPDEDKDQATSFTENSFYYQGQYDLKHKIILIEDLDGASGAMYAMRELQTKRYIIKKVPYKNSKGETVTKSIRVEGPVCMAGCTTQEKIYEDNANRSFLIYIDESKEQDERIMDYQRKKSAGKTDTQKENEAKKLMQNTQHILQPITVRNPFAEALKIPLEVFKPRRTNGHYLQFIEAITFYHQFQREEKTDESTAEVYIETTLQDIAEANKLMKEILLRKSDELSGACRNYFEQLKKWMKAENKKSFTNREARSALRENHSNQKRYMLQLMQEGCLYKKIGDQKKGYVYEVVSFEEWNETQKKITSVLDEILEKLKGEVQSSKAVHNANEPLNSYVNNKQFSKNGKVQARVKKPSSLNLHA